MMHFRSDSINPAQGPGDFYATGSVAGIQSEHAKRLRMLLAALDTATNLQDMDVPGFRLHRLKGKDAGRWSVRVSGNWRPTFEFSHGQAQFVDYEDYH
ncbi:MAG: type II toxin-antitoxin system RelE/ParE family toxin [Xanthomonadales bacterium]|nr:type II toxin-antitoxin system RelE/ParE family toxin [Xanthomonadales bacterium]